MLLEPSSHSERGKGKQSFFDVNSKLPRKWIMNDNDNIQKFV